MKYAPGVLEAVSYCGGKEVSRAVLKTTGVPKKLRACSEKAEIAADGRSLAFVNLELLDENDQRVSHADVKVTAKVEGPATLEAFGSACPATTENYTAGEFTTYEGRLQAIVRSGCEAGEVVITFAAEGLAPVEVKISCK